MMLDTTNIALGLRRARQDEKRRWRVVGPACAVLIAAFIIWMGWELVK